MSNKLTDEFEKIYKDINLSHYLQHKYIIKTKLDHRITSLLNEECIREEHMPTGINIDYGSRLKM